MTLSKDNPIKLLCEFVIWSGVNVLFLGGTVNAAPSDGYERQPLSKSPSAKVLITARRSGRLSAGSGQPVTATIKVRPTGAKLPGSVVSHVKANCHWKE